MKKRLLSLILVVLMVVLSACSSGGNDVSRAYDEALNAMKQGKYADAVDKLAGISFYQDSTQLSLYCRAHEKAAEGDYDYAVEELEKLGSYRDAVQSAVYFAARKAEAAATDPYSRAYAARLYDKETINGFRDSMTRAISIRTKLYEEGLKAQEAESWADASERFGVLGKYQDSETRYYYTYGRLNEADGERAGASYAYAAVFYDYIPDYLDSADRKKQCIELAYQKADQLIAAADKAPDLKTATVDLAEAEGIYRTLDNLCDKNKLTKIDEARARAVEAERQRLIAKADALLLEKKFDEARELYLQAEEPQMAKEALIKKADELLVEKRFDEAREVYLQAEEPQMGNEALYLKAEHLAGEKKPEEAAVQYREIFGYKDSREKHYQLGNALKETDPETASRILLNDIDYPGAEDDLYGMALKATEAENYPFSISVYGGLTGRRDCSLRMLNDLYLYGQRMLQEEDPEKAASIFDQLKGVGSADLYANMARYAAAEALEKSGSYEAAAKAFELIAGYTDAADRADKARYAAAEVLEKNGSYEAAAKAFDLMTGYADTADRADNCRYQLAAEKKKNGQYLEAASIFAALGDREDSTEQEKNCCYLQAEAYANRKAWESAINLYEELSDYAESKTRCAECYRQLGLEQLADEAPEKAYRSFVLAGDADGQAKAAFAVGEMKTADLQISEALKWYELASELPETEERTAMIAQSLLNMEEDALSEQYASVVSDSEKAQNVLYALALRSLERKDEEAAMRQMKKAGDNADASERFKAMLNERVETLISEEKYDDAIFLCNTYGEQERAEEIWTVKAEKEEVERQKVWEAREEAHREKAAEAEQLLKDGKYDEAAALYTEIGETDQAAKALAEKEEAEKAGREEHYLAGKAMLDSDPESAFRALAEDLTYADVKTILYELADRESKAENYWLSYEIFETLADLPLDPENPMPDCWMRGRQDMYLYGLQLQNGKEWDAAAGVFDRLSDFSNARTHALECRYAAAEVLEEEGKYSQAVLAFGKLGTYNDAQERVQKNQYAAAVALEEEGEYLQAASAFKELGAYNDAQERVQKNSYQAAKKRMESGSLENAAAAFEELGRYSDAAEMAKECRYRIAFGKFESGAYAEARDLFAVLGDYSDSGEKKNECIYQIAEQLMSQSMYAEAIAAYETVGDYQDAAAKVAACRVKIADLCIEQAEMRLKEGKTDQAIASYLSAYLEYKKNEDEEHIESLTLRIAECYQFISDLTSALKWYKTDGEKGKTRIMEIAEYAFLTEQYEAAEVLALEADMDAGRELLYRLAEHMLMAGDEEAALRLFEEAGDAQDAKFQHDTILWKRALKRMEEKDYLAAIDLLDMIPDYEGVLEKKQEAIHFVATSMELTGAEDARTKESIQRVKLFYANDLIEKKEYEAAIEILKQIDQTPEIEEQVNSIKYVLAETKEEIGDYESAIAIWTEIVGYGDSAERITASVYHQAVACKDAQLYDKAIELLQMILDYEDACDQITDCLYLKAGSLTSAGEFGRALEIYQTIPDYKDVRELIINSEGLKNELTAWQHNIQPGDIVGFFGHTDNGDPYSWVVLDREDNYLCLIAADLMDEKPFMEGNISRVTWEHSTLRSYLNTTFLESVFTGEERQAIRLTGVKAEKEPDSDISPGNNTEDYIYVLNQQEVIKYRPILLENLASGDWWLRSPGKAPGIIMKLDRDSYDTRPLYSNHKCGIRPVIWVRDDMFITTGIVPETKEQVSDQSEGKTWMGVEVVELNGEDVKNGWPCPGLLIVSVTENGPAYQAGLRPGDIIVRMGSSGIKTIDELNMFMLVAKPGQIVRIGYRHADSFEIILEDIYSFHYEKITSSTDITLGVQ